MLAQNFKTPADLGLSDAEFEALVKVLGMLERGEIADKDFTMNRIGWMSAGGYLQADPDCGSAGCIIGWARFVAHKNLFHARSIGEDSPLFKLFMFARSTDDPITETRRTVMQPQAAIALRNYLTHGEPRWDEALAER